MQIRKEALCALGTTGHSLGSGPPGAGMSSPVQSGEGGSPGAAAVLGLMVTPDGRREA